MNEYETVLKVLAEKINALETELYIKKLENELLKKQLEEAKNE